MLSINGIEIKPTIFPDKTSQIWLLPNEVLEPISYSDNSKSFEILWKFEGEGEIVHLCQLLLLLHSVDNRAKKNLWIRTLPYARQDKEVSNQTTFAFRAFAWMLNNLDLDEIFIIDPHNYQLTEELIPDCTILQVESNIDYTYAECEADNIVFPDKGASKRYQLTYKNPVILDKVRDQLTGEITGLKIVSGEVKIGRSYLIADDICDGGKTFIETAKILYLYGAKNVHLYVSHGIFSKGLEPLREAGIKRIFTYDGEVK